MKLSHFFNGEGIQLIHQPAAHTAGDSLVWFRGSDVIAAGDIYSTVSYPVIDVKHGGTINGVIDGLNRILDLVGRRVQDRRRHARHSRSRPAE